MCMCMKHNYIEWLISLVAVYLCTQEHLGAPCITDGCQGVIKAIKHYEGLGRPKIIAQVRITAELKHLVMGQTMKILCR